MSFLSLVRVPQGACEQDAALLAQVECLWAESNSLEATAGAGAQGTPFVPCTDRKRRSKSLRLLGPQVPHLSHEGISSFSVNVSCELFAVLSQGASGL